jgi:hypothetical protein
MNADLFTPDDTRDALRKIGGILLGLAALMIAIRKGPVSALNEDQWAAFPMFLVFAVPAAYLYGSIFTRPRTGELRVWQVVHSTFGLIFVPMALFQFIDMIGGSASSLNTFWIFGVTAALGFYAGAVVGVRVQLLLGSIAAIISWSGLWNEILSDGIGAHYGVYRGLLGILSIGLLAGALYLWRTNVGRDEVASSATAPTGDLGLWKASELFTGAGIAAVLACSLGVTAVVGLISPVATTNVAPIGTSNFWDVLLLVISLGLVGIGSQIGTRGPVYVGAVGLFFFLLIAGLDLNGDPPEPFKMGLWPWILLVFGLAAIVLSFVKESSQGDRPRRLIESLRGR